MKRKEYNEVTNKIVNVDQVISRGQREPVFELTFKTSGYNRFEGSRVYIDFRCAQELLKKLEPSVREVESKYHPFAFYERLQRTVEEIL